MMSGGYVQTVKGMILLPRRRAVGARGSCVDGSAARRWQRRHSCENGGAGQPADREAGGRWRLWLRTANRLPLFAVLRLDARLARAAASLLLDTAEAELATAAVLELMTLENEARLRFLSRLRGYLRAIRRVAMYVTSLNEISRTVYLYLSLRLLVLLRLCAKSLLGP